MAYNYALKKHGDQKYHDKPYEVHLMMVYNVAQKYIDNIPVSYIMPVLSACFTHDIIEDCKRASYETLRHLFGTEVANITRAVTKVNGESPKEYFKKIAQTRFAPFIKVCDRIANVKYGVEHHNLLQKYIDENTLFCYYMAPHVPEEMIIELNTLIYKYASN